MQHTTGHNAVSVPHLTKRFDKFKLEIEDLHIPEGYATALIGENGAGKTTLCNLLSGIRLDGEGAIRWFDETEDIDTGMTRERIGYTGTGHFFLPGWTVSQVRKVSQLLFSSFHAERFDAWCRHLQVVPDGKPWADTRKIASLSDGNRTKLMLACTFARDTELLVMDEPASPLDPVMRENLNDMIRNYLLSGETDAEAARTDGADYGHPLTGRPRTVLFSTHNVQDMERVTDYAIIMSNGRIVLQGFVEDLKEQFVLVKGDADTLEAAKTHLYSVSESGSYGYEGLCLAEDVDKLSGLNITREVPSLFQISVAVMKHHAAVQA